VVKKQEKYSRKQEKQGKQKIKNKYIQQIYRMAFLTEPNEIIPKPHDRWVDGTGWYQSRAVGGKKTMRKNKRGKTRKNKSMRMKRTYNIRKTNKRRI